MNLLNLPSLDYVDTTDGAVEFVSAISLKLPTAQVFGWNVCGGNAQPYGNHFSVALPLTKTCIYGCSLLIYLTCIPFWKKSNKMV